MKTDENATRSRLIAKTSAGAVRLVSLRMSKKERALVNESQSYARSVKSFLETEVQPPFYYHQITNTAFAFNSRCEDERFEAFCEDIYERLVAFLFGTERAFDGEILIFSGPEEEIAKFASEPEEEARARSSAYMAGIRERKREAAQAPDTSLNRISGQRPLFYRGILAVPHNVLLAYAMTPASNTWLQNQSAPPSDIDIGRYLDFRGSEAVDFTERLIQKASDLMQTGDKLMSRVVLLVPLSYSSLLSHQDREAVLELVRATPDWVRRQIILSVFNAPPQPSTSVIQRFIGEFAPYFRNIDWQVSTPDVKADLFLGCHLNSLTFDLHRLHDGSRDRLLEKFLKSVPSIHAQKIHAAVTGLNDPEEVEACIKGGVTYLSGDAIAAPLKTCAPAQKIALNDLPILEPTVLQSVA
tara:strand:- start:10629 stop:11867 length:1239 start_codon:yes stop_codon:yes gene_type:complete